MLGGADGPYILGDSGCAIRVAAPRHGARMPRLPHPAQEAAAVTRPARTASLSVWWSRSFWSA